MCAACLGFYCDPSDCQLIQEANHFIYIGMFLSVAYSLRFANYLCLRWPTRESILVSHLFLTSCANCVQYCSSVSATKEGGQIKNQIAAALVQRIIRAAQRGEKFKVRSQSFHSPRSFNCLY